MHWPFCTAKCPYCDFNSHVAANIDQTHWAEAFDQELARYHHQVPERTVKSIFFGGGTPSLMEGETVRSLLRSIQSRWRVANDVEITLEANPSSADAGRFAAYRDAGVDRLSLGIQALNDTDLRRLGRLHDVAQGLRAVEMAQDIFARVSIDLIYARQHQSLAEWDRELARALGFGLGHLSLYQLTIEDGTAFGDRHRAGKLGGLPEGDLAADMYELTQQVCGERGLPAYEISNHAQPGSESRHNLNYWRGGDWLGVGPGAHGRLSIAGQRFATETRRAPSIWLKNVAGGSGEKSRDQLSQRDQTIEALMMGLRMAEGVELRRLEPQAWTVMAEGPVAELVDTGHLMRSGERLIATDKGRLVLNSVLRELCAGL